MADDAGRQPAPHDLIKALDESGADALQPSREIAKAAQSKSGLTNNLREPSTESLR